jgi:hypothetical protein
MIDIMFRIFIVEARWEHWDLEESLSLPLILSSRASEIRNNH